MKPKITVKLLKGHPPTEVADFDAEYTSVPGMQHVAWSDMHWCWNSIIWTWAPRPRGYVSARKKKTRRERRWRRRNRR